MLVSRFESSRSTSHLTWTYPAPFSLPSLLNRSPHPEFCPTKCTWHYMWGCYTSFPPSYPPSILFTLIHHPYSYTSCQLAGPPPTLLGTLTLHPRHLHHVPCDLPVHLRCYCDLLKLGATGSLLSVMLSVMHSLPIPCH